MGGSPMRVIGIIMLIVQIVLTVILLPVVVIAGPVMWFFRWISFITWIVCVLAGRRA